MQRSPASYAPEMSLAAVLVLVGLTALTGLLLCIEQRGARTTLQLSFRGDIRRETAFLAQYAQSVCTPVVFVLVWQLDPAQAKPALAVGTAVAGTAAIGVALKRLFGRVRPNREQAGRFLGPTWRHESHRESFPSNHTATAVALSTVLAALYPAAAVTFWVLAAIAAMLRYVQDAHWPSDIVAGVVMGYLVAHCTLVAFGMA